MFKKNVLVTTGAGYGNAILATPLIRKLADLNYAVDVLTDKTYNDFNLIFDNSIYVRRNSNRELDLLEEYDYIIPTWWGKIPTDIKGTVLARKIDKHNIYEVKYNLLCGNDLLNLKDEDFYDYSGFFSDLTYKAKYDRICLVNPDKRIERFRDRRYPRVKELCMIIRDILGEKQSICIVGSKKDEEQWNIDDIPDFVERYVTKNIYEAGKVITESKYFIGQDCGLSHIAGVTNTPSFILFGPTDPIKNRPLGKETNIIMSRSKNMKDINPINILETLYRYKIDKILESYIDD